MTYEETDFGQLIINPTGEYKEGERYEYLDFVIFEGIGYICINENGTTEEPGSDSTDWKAWIDLTKIETKISEMNNLIKEINGKTRSVPVYNETAQVLEFKADTKNSYTSDDIYFTVSVNQAETDVQEQTTEIQDSEDISEVACILRLPESYSPTGRKTPLILCAHGTSGYIKYTNGTGSYQSQFDRWNDFVEAGYAVYDVNGGSAYELYNTGQNMGSPRTVEAYYKAYQYIIDNYNIDPYIYVAGQSMGGLAALNFVNSHSDICRCIGLLYPVTDLYHQAWLHPWNDITKNRIIQEYSFAGSNWDGDKVVGYNPVDNKSFVIDSTKYTLTNAPIKIWHGTSDSVVDYNYSIKYIEAIKNCGGVGMIRLVEGAGHGEASFSEWRTIFNRECLYYFNKFTQY